MDVLSRHSYAILLGDNSVGHAFHDKAFAFTFPSINGICAQVLAGIYCAENEDGCELAFKDPCGRSCYSVSMSTHPCEKFIKFGVFDKAAVDIGACLLGF